MTERKADYLVCCANAENRGISSMAEDFCRNMPADAIIVDPERKPPMKQYPERFANVRATFKWSDQPTLAQLEPLMDGYKAVVFIETFVNAIYIQAAHDSGAMTVGIPMWEVSPKGIESVDLLIGLSSCEMSVYPEAVQMRWPVDTAVLGSPPSPVSPPMRFLHNAGNLGIHYRNATKTVLDASWGMFGTGTAVKIKIRHLQPLPREWACDGKAIEFEPAPKTRENLYAGADGLIALRRFGGDSLPINEATALGLPVIVSDIPCYAAYPNRVPCVENGSFESPAGFTIPLYDPDASALAEMLSGMARGAIPLEPTPDVLKPPTWDQFKKQWRRIVR